MIGPATHRPDAPGVVVHPLDQAWDHQRIADERSAIAVRTEQLAEERPAHANRLRRAHVHPVDAYRRGWTRYDIEAPMRLFVPRASEEGEDRYVEVKASDYLTMGDPDKVTIKRLSAEEWAEISLDHQPRAEAVARVAGLKASDAYALVELDRQRQQRAIHRAAESASGMTVGELYAMAADMPAIVGNAAIIHSGPPQEHELFLSA